MTNELELILDKLISDTPVTADEVNEVILYLTRLTLITAGIDGRDLLKVSPAERLNLPPDQFDDGKLRVAEDYADSFYPVEFDYVPDPDRLEEWEQYHVPQLKDSLAKLPSGEARKNRLRSEFISWLRATWKKEDAEAKFRAQPPEATEDRPAQDHAESALSSLATDGTPKETRNRQLFHDALRQYADPLETWVERHRGERRWIPFIYLYDGNPMTRPLEIQFRDFPQILVVPSKQDLADAQFRALEPMVCHRRKPTSGKQPRRMTALELADELGIPHNRVDYLIRLEKEFQADHRKS